MHIAETWSKLYEYIVELTEGERVDEIIIVSRLRFPVSLPHGIWHSVCLVVELEEQSAG